jgi:hypothetical protein
VQATAKAVAASVDSSGGIKFIEFIAAADTQGSLKKILQKLGFDDKAESALVDFILAATTTTPLDVEQKADPIVTPAPEKVQTAAVKLADAAYPILAKLNSIGGDTVAPVLGKAINIAFSGDAAKVGKAVDVAVETIDSVNTANIFDVLMALDVALDAAVRNKGLLPPLEAVEGVARAVASALVTASPEKLKSLIPAILDASSSADKLKILGVVGEASSLIAKIPPADITAASSAALSLVQASGAR